MIAYKSEGVRMIALDAGHGKREHRVRRPALTRNVKGCLRMSRNGHPWPAEPSLAQGNITGRVDPFGRNRGQHASGGGSRGGIAVEAASSGGSGSGAGAHGGREDS